jgi:DNA polymerase
VPVVVTYHPTYLLRAPQDKRKAWEDLQLAMAQVPPLPAAQEG